MNEQKFEQLVADAIDNLPEETRGLLHNVAILIEDEPTKEQKKAAGIGKQFELFGLFEGFCQSRRLNFGPVLPDRITIFRRPILRNYFTEDAVKAQVENTLKHEIAHHFGSDEPGARKAASH